MIAVYYNFIVFIENEIKKEEVKKEKSTGTISSYYKDLSKLKRFKPSLQLNDLTVSFLSSYEAYMRNTLKNAPNRIHRSLKFIRTFNNRAITQKMTEKYPFDEYKLKLEETHKESLTEIEIHSLTVLYNTLSEKDNTRKSLAPFLFCCYTGIRFSDAALLRFKDINNGILTIRMHKTKDIVSIPLLDQAKQFLTLNSSVNQVVPNNEMLVFDLPGNQVANKQIKRCCKKVGIEKEISFHCSRHTFGTVAMSNNMPPTTVQKILGHRKIEQTLAYAKTTDIKVVEDMGKLNLALNKTIKTVLPKHSTTVCLTNSNWLLIKRC